MFLSLPVQATACFTIAVSSPLLSHQGAVHSELADCLIIRLKRNACGARLCNSILQFWSEHKQVITFCFTRHPIHWNQVCTISGFSALFRRNVFKKCNHWFGSHSDMFPRSYSKWYNIDRNGAYEPPYLNIRLHQHLHLSHIFPNLLYWTKLWSHRVLRGHKSRLSQIKSVEDICLHPIIS